MKAGSGRSTVPAIQTMRLARDPATPLDICDDSGCGSNVLIVRDLHERKHNAVSEENKKERRHRGR